MVPQILSDSNLITSAYVNVALGVFFLVSFVFVQSRSILFKFRLVSPAVSCKPPVLPVGMNAIWAWFWATLTVSDMDLLASCGLDALMFIKMWTLGEVLSENDSPLIHEDNFEVQKISDII